MEDIVCCAYCFARSPQPLLHLRYCSNCALSNVVIISPSHRNGVGFMSVCLGTKVITLICAIPFLLKQLS